jgi:NAD(P)-dependent dehydrogenase (short-subunit alcohol dehydrogenase family)
LLLAADLGDSVAVDDLWRRAVAWRGRIDVLVSNAAIMHWHGGFEGDDDALWDRVWDETWRVNVLAPARLMRHAVKQFRAQGGGALIAASKAAIKAAAQTIARGYARENILSYVVAPGVVDTAMSAEAALTQGGAAVVNAGLAMGEPVPPAEVADLIAYLATGRARHLSGATLDINGASYVR